MPIPGGFFHVSVSVANPPVADAFMAKILIDLGATFLASLFLVGGRS
jgi:hypothetical protein